MEDIVQPSVSRSPEQLLDNGLALMKTASFGEAVNMLRSAADHPEASEPVRAKALAAIEVIGEINGFVNVDLMNP